MVKANLTVNNEQLRELVNQFPAEAIAAMPNTIESFAVAVERVRNLWTDYLNGDGTALGIDPPEKVNANMIKSIRVRYLDKLSAEVYSDNRQLEEIQNGTHDVEYDMKKTHPYGRKSRVSKDGIPYLIIPFRWGTPNDKGTKRAHFQNFIPKKEYVTNIKGFSLSKTLTSTHTEKNYSGDPIKRAEYIFKDRLREIDSFSDRATGMVKMKDLSSGKGTYFTFRIISARSPQDKWWYRRKGTPGVDMIGALERAADKILNDTVKAGLEADERNLIR